MNSWDKILDELRHHMQIIEGEAHRASAGAVDDAALYTSLYMVWWMTSRDQRIIDYLANALEDKDEAGQVRSLLARCYVALRIVFPVNADVLGDMVGKAMDGIEHLLRQHGWVA